MYERGVRATSVDDVLHAAGAAKSQLYHYFASRDDLAVAVLEHQLAQVLDHQAGFRLETWAGLRAWFDALLEGQRARGYRGCPVGSMSAEMSAISSHMADCVGAAFERWRAELDDAFAEMRRSGRLRAAARPGVLAQVTLAQIQGGYLLSSAAQDAEPLKRALDSAYAYLRSYAS
jgi:AcrR family transcriptional regulator